MLSRLKIGMPYMPYSGFETTTSMPRCNGPPSTYLDVATMYVDTSKDGGL